MRGKPGAHWALPVVLMGLLGAVCGSSAVGGRPSAVPASVAAEAPADALSCAAGEWTNQREECVPAAEAFTAPGGRTFWVDGARGDDAADGSEARPWRTISRAAGPRVLRPGDAVLIRAGVYRETLYPRAGGTGADARVTYAAYPGDAVVVTGADPADSGWTRDGDAWRRRWTGPSMTTYADEPEFRREMVVAGGTVLRPVYRRGDVRPGTFWAEGPPEAPRALVARFPGDGPPRGVEVATRTYLFRPLGADPEPACGGVDTPGWLRVTGITFRHAANRAQWGAVCTGREGALFERVVVEWTNGRGLDVSGRGHTIRGGAASYNGQIGAGGACTGCLFDGLALVGNNWKGHDAGWEAGGGKWHHTRDTVFRRIYAADNDGPGLWLDGTNTRNTIEGGRYERNAMAGIMLELETTRTLVQHNVIRDTRVLGYSGAGILSQAASDNALVHNTVTGSAGSGIWLRHDPERRAPDGRYVVVGNLVLGNATATDDFEGREVMVEGATPGDLRGHRFAGNGWGRRASNDMVRSTFYAWPDPPHEAGFRDGDLAGWTRVMGAVGDRLVGPEALRTPPAMPALRVDLGRYGAPDAGARSFGLLGADPSIVRAAE